MSERRRPAGVRGAVAVLVLALAACTAEEPTMGVSPPATPSPTPAPSRSESASAEPTSSPTSSPTPSPAALRGRVEASARTVVDGLDVPWGLAPLDDGRLLISLRDEARLVVVDPQARTTTPVTGPGADRLASETRPEGEGGLLGVAVDPESGEVFVYRTGADDNAVLRGRFDGGQLGRLSTVVDGIPKASNHDGGRLAFGPDGYLYVTTGDAADTSNSQDPESLGGKILRVTADGEPAPGNPDRGSPVWSFGHRNVQGVGWDPEGRMFASEFGQNTLDEVNLIEPGSNYGWPDVEGPGGGDAGFVDPIAWWPTSDASPSGLAVTADAVYVAGLRGERLWRVPFDGEGFGRPQALLQDHGRLRTVVANDDGSLWVLTNNTDGRGVPAEGDDRLLRVRLAPEE
jgi:glucose/arabinose dehydrogenase